ncbi:unnamed protein product [Rhizophagus irregularis]|nr:unnamed protein product [Rhizophagus irregularis]
MDKENDKDIVVNEINILNSEVSDNLINEDFDLEIYKQHVLSQEYGLCIESQGGFSTIFKANRLDGWINKWDYEKHDWDRIIEELGEQDYEDSINPKTKNPLKINEKYGLPVVLKSLNDSSNINDNFLNEWKLHLQCQYRAALYGSVLAPLMGITQDPDTFNYMIVMMKMESSLRTQLEAIHKLNLVHGDLHNVLPYMAPEVLRGKPYTKAADIYSFGMIIGIRPEIIEENIQQRKIKKREYLYLRMNRKLHTIPKTYYKSRKIDYSAKINEILQSETLDCIITEEEAAAQEFSDYEEN